MLYISIRQSLIEYIFFPVKCLENKRSKIPEDHIKQCLNIFSLLLLMYLNEHESLL